MSEEKDVFSDLVRERLSEFEVPYNERHWDEMNQRLDEAGSFAGPEKPWYSSGYVIIAAAAAALVATLLLWPSAEMKTVPEEDSQAPVLTEQPSSVQQPSQNNEKKNDTDPALSSPSNPTEIETEKTKSTPQFTVEEKVERAASHSEMQLKQDAQEELDKRIQKQQEAIPTSPNIDNPVLRTNIVVNATAFCVGEEIHFSSDRELKDVSYRWTFGDRGLTSTQKNPKRAFTRAGTFQVLLLVSKNGEEKNNYQTNTTITIHEAPDVHLEIEPKELSVYDPYLEVHAQTAPNSKFDWKFSGKPANGHSETVDFWIPAEGNYEIQVQVTGANGCKTTKEHLYNAKRGAAMFVEGNFRINNDMNPRNETFIPKELQYTEATFTFQVMDETGRIVFESHNGSNAWNGSLNNVGNPLPEGNYSWVVTLKDVKGVPYTQKGRVRLMRR